MKTIISVVASFVIVGVVCAQSLERAELFKEHGLADDAKRELILIVTSSSDKAAKAHAYYLLGAVAFEQNHISCALSSWRTVVSKFPDSDEAKEVAGRLKDLGQNAGEIARESLDNAVAEGYIRNGDFWSRGKREVFGIDDDYISEEQAAVKWYDKAISEFPKSAAAKLAYEEKMRCLLGWVEADNGRRHGLVRNFAECMPELLTAFEGYERDFPDAETLQAFRYQIAQAYWAHGDWESACTWLKLITEKNSGGDSFYVDLAKRRLATGARQSH
jgi:tetratricopeptide (TPR) repeat protein